MLRILLFICCSLMLCVSGYCQPKKTRIIILTDIGNEPDDAQSLVRFLIYANQFDVEGIIATTSVWLKNETNEWRIHNIVDAYGKVRDNLEKHEQGFPTDAELKKKIKKGIPVFGMEGVGEGKNSEGSELIINMLDKNDPRPLWITIWGGANCLAQALWKINETHSREETERVVSKLRVYAISDQDDSGYWIRKTFPELFFICSPGYEENGSGGYHFGTWTGISGDSLHGRFGGADFNIVKNPWLNENIRQNHGPLGQEYPLVKYLMEGDSPSFLYLIQNGLGDPEHPEYGGWGGRYEYYLPATQNWHYGPEASPLWTNASDEVFSDITGRYHTGIQATIWRWRQAYQNDFAARMDWTTKTFEASNHPPVSSSESFTYLDASPGDTVSLKASGWSDPDGDSLLYQWIYYREAGNSVYWIEIEDADKPEARFILPDFDYPQELHFVLSVTDNGMPALTRYQRVIVRSGGFGD